EQMNMSRSNFYRKIKALSGMSPNDYLKALRMNKAAELIQGGTRIPEVAAQVGFTSSSYFAKCFKAQYGVLPKEYVNQ
ncbi:helix-turn-helix transcriptional regulator, partial [Parabacteroides distasonis]|uniref:helix-turn-helix domain-containing protein n=1 Tax=Parabacteroides distasonis TaxID=823 RepID=UPI001C38724B